MRCPNGKEAEEDEKQKESEKRYKCPENSLDIKVWLIFLN